MIPFEETPCASGVPRGKDVCANAPAWRNKRKSNTRKRFMVVDFSRKIMRNPGISFVSVVFEHLNSLTFFWESPKSDYSLFGQRETLISVYWICKVASFVTDNSRLRQGFKSKYISLVSEPLSF